MDKYLMVPLNLFTLNQTVFIVDEKKYTRLGEYRVQELPMVLFSLCQENNIKLIKISSNSNYSDGLINSIKKLEKAKYSTNKIKIEVI